MVLVGSGYPPLFVQDGPYHYNLCLGGALREWFMRRKQRKEKVMKNQRADVKNPNNRDYWSDRLNRAVQARQNYDKKHRGRRS